MTTEHREDVLTLIGEAIRAELIDTHTALPGRIQSYDEATQLAEVIPELQREIRNEDGTLEALPIAPIPDVPVMTPRGGGYAMTFPVQPGDKCLLVFSERDLSGWLTTGQEAVPPSARRHEYSDAIAILGLWPQPSVLSPAPATDGLEIRSDNGATKIKIGAAGIEITSSGVTSIDSGGAVTITRGPSELLDLLSQTLQGLATATAGGDPLANAATFTALKVLVDAMKA